MALHAAVRFAYFWGDMTLQFTSRLGLIFLPLLVTAAIHFLHKMSCICRFNRSWAAVLMAALLGYSWPSAGLNLGIREIFYYREFRIVRDFLEREYPDKSRYIIISDLSNLYVPLSYSAILPGYLHANIERFKIGLEKKTWQLLLVVQKIDYAGNKPAEGSIVDEKISLEPVFEEQLHAGQMLRISRVTGL
jgi:hypothetical protein